MPNVNGPNRVISGGAGPSPTRQVKLNKRTLTPRTVRLSFVQKLRIVLKNSLTRLLEAIFEPRPYARQLCVALLGGRTN